MSKKKKAEFGAEAVENTVAINPIVGLAREDLIGAVALMMREMVGKPQKTLKHLKSFSEEVVKIVKNQSEIAPDAKDRRFIDITFKYNPLYRMGMQYYLAANKGVQEWLADLELDELERARANFVSQMIMDSVSPTNSLIGNPAAMKRVYESGGMSLLAGLKNAYEDLTKNGGQVSQVNKKPFKIGENLALSVGSIVHKTEMMELIQYAPTTEKVREIPILIIPPQINKAYINDLSPEKSIVRFLTSIGCQVFLVSWRNPTKEHSDWGLSAYVDELIVATDVIIKITNSPKINVSGACSGGITTATLASKLAAQKDKRINAISLMVSVLDPQQNDSEVGALVSNNGVELARARSAKEGILKGDDLACMFAWLRPNDLVWNYVVNNYLLGQDPPAFDILFWNNDTTNLPAQLHSDLLDMYVNQPFTNHGEIDFAGHKLDISKITNDVFIVAGVTDHITPWKACYRTTQLLGSKNIEFVLSHSGHIQALLNPPGNPKSKYYVNDKSLPKSPDKWQDGAHQIDGSWWPKWGEWLQMHSGAEIDAPQSIGNDEFAALYDAPGRYCFNE